jgi:hypothetical protein
MNTKEMLERVRVLEALLGDAAFQPRVRERQLAGLGEDELLTRAGGREFADWFASLDSYDQCRVAWGDLVWDGGGMLAC